MLGLTDQLTIARQRADIVWHLACNYDSLDPCSQLVEFSPENPFAPFYAHIYKRTERLLSQQTAQLN